MGFILKFIILLIAIQSTSCAYFCKYLYKAECSKSSKFLQFNKCRTVTTARYNGTFLLNMTLLQKWTKLKIAIRLHYKPLTSRNFNKVYAFEYPDICPVFRSKIFGKNYWLTECVSRLPQLCHECPILPGNIIFNYTEYENEVCPSQQIKGMPILSGLHWPDGEYKQTFEFYVNGDTTRHYVIVYGRHNLGDKSSF